MCTPSNGVIPRLTRETLFPLLSSYDLYAQDCRPRRFEGDRASLYRLRVDIFHSSPFAGSRRHRGTTGHSSLHDPRLPTIPRRRRQNIEGGLTRTNQCYRCQGLSKEVDEVLSEMVILRTEQLDAFQKGDIGTSQNSIKNSNLRFEKKSEASARLENIKQPIG
jgi:hypothetical protein